MAGGLTWHDKWKMCCRWVDVTGLKWKMGGRRVDVAR